ncbi:hypothetical protein N177_2225 [Lutibaculum baratangense AMV1]|uniref:Uncharacterized protein n=1 Tax=Lutibaculum baratangense AMV1 TaxID=631454 RepID=V4QYV2_9HYPH|nr:hypothetical protein N177_2225 [Lutibaculum baratangense AMV1]
MASLLGGVLIGLSAVMAMALFGRIAGITGIVTQTMWAKAAHRAGDWSWRAAFLLGLLAAPLLYALATGSPVEQTVSGNLPLMAVAGLLVGFGTALGSGCTSGHGVCGLARLSPRSLVSVLVFMGVAVATVTIARHVLAGVL